jgi:hypothetical protein
MKFDFLTLAQAARVEAARLKFSLAMAWNKITKKSDSGADPKLATETKTVDSGVIKARAPRKTK